MLNYFIFLDRSDSDYIDSVLNNYKKNMLSDILSESEKYSFFHEIKFNSYFTPYKNMAIIYYKGFIACVEDKPNIKDDLWGKYCSYVSSNVEKKLTKIKDQLNEK